MPELPEVEITARNLRRWLAGRAVVGANVAATRVVRGSSPEAIERLLLGARVRAVERRGKWLRLCLDGGNALYSHLGMTGKWVRRATGAPPEPHERARIEVAGASVRYLDARLFGRLLPASNGVDPTAGLGRDPLDAPLDAAWLAVELRGKRRPLKQALMEQDVVAGLGNIQVTEALWRARLHPALRTERITDPEARRLVAAIHASLRHALRAETSDEVRYVEEPGAPNPFRVYGRAGRPCPRCRAVLRRVVMAGRGTVFCPACQPGPRGARGAGVPSRSRGGGRRPGGAGAPRRPLDRPRGGG